MVFPKSILGQPAGGGLWESMEELKSFFLLLRLFSAVVNEGMISGSFVLKPNRSGELGREFSYPGSL